MTVAELIAELQKMPQHLPMVVFAADEHLTEKFKIKVEPNAEIPIGSPIDYSTYKTIEAVYIGP